MYYIMSVSVPTCVNAAINFNSHTHCTRILAEGHDAQLPGDNRGSHITENSSKGIDISRKYLKDK